MNNAGYIDLYALKHAIFDIFVKTYFVYLQDNANIGFSSATLKQVWHCTRLAQYLQLIQKQRR